MNKEIEFISSNEVVRYNEGNFTPYTTTVRFNINEDIVMDAIFNRAIVEYMVDNFKPNKK